MEKITRKSLLYKSGVKYSDYCINHVVGCAHGCKFPCYALKMSKVFGTVKSYDDWVKPKLVENALALLDKEIPKHKDKIKFVHLCFSTDPFMYNYPEVSEMSLKIIKKLNANGIKCTSLTKGVYPEELTDKTRFGNENEYGITLVSLNEDFRKKWEPFTSTYRERIESLKRLSSADLKTWVSIEPYPTPNLVAQSLEEIAELVSFTNKIVFGRWNYNRQVSEFKDHKKFYRDCKDFLADFCRVNGKEFFVNRPETI